MARIAIGGFQHETNTFAPVQAHLDQFKQADAWPGLTRGSALIPALADMNIPVSGFVARARALGHDPAPLTWCAATPSAHVTTRAFEIVAGMLLRDLLAQGPVDAVYLDLHANVTPAMVEDATARRLEQGPVHSISFTPGFPPADIYHCGRAILAYGTEPGAVERAADGLTATVLRQERDFNGRLYDPGSAVRRAMAATPGRGPVILTDTQDTPTADPNGRLDD